MSQQMFADDIQFYERLLKCAGLFNGQIDGQWTARTDAADRQFDSVYETIKMKRGAFDSRSESNIRTLMPTAQEAARRFLDRASKGFPNLSVRIISGTCTYAEQEALYRKGRGDPGRIVTKASGGQSNHNFGIAWDVGIFDSGRYITGDSQQEEKIYRNLAPIVMNDALEWGGNWTSFTDLPHYQMKLSLTLPQVRPLFEAGTKIV